MTTPCCPRCAIALEPFELDAGTTLDVCARCKGAWFDRGELTRVLGAHGATNDALPDDLPLAEADAPTCPRCAGVCMVRVRYASHPAAPWVHRCPYCEGTWSSLTDLPAMRSMATAPIATPSPPSEGFVYDLDNPLPDELTFRQCLVAMPAAFAVVAAVRSFSLGRVLLSGSRVTLHELGHAFAGWACAWRALPLPIGVTFLTPGRHLGVHAFFLALTAGVGCLAWKRRALALLTGAVGFGLVQIGCTWGLSPSRQDELVTFAGCGGEIVLGAMLVAAFFHRMPERLRWPRFRWVALAIGACAFIDASMFWREAAADWELIPWDAALADTGDMTKLVEGHQWHEALITRRYTALSVVCGLALVADQMSACVRAWRRERRGGTGSETTAP